MLNFSRLLAVFAPNSTRANKYLTKVRSQLVNFARENNAAFHEIAIEKLPYDNAYNVISRQINDGDLIVSCGGDGLTQVSFDAAFSSKKSAIFATIPLGNGNDFSRALNGNKTNPQNILRQNARDFYPLKISIHSAKSKKIIALSSYITFGATTVLVDSLNCENARARRRKLRILTPAVSLPISKLNQLSRKISALNFPIFQNNGQKSTDDSFGFFVVNAARGLLRLPKKITFDKTDFFFHCAKTCDKNLINKIIMAGIWSAHFPGKITNDKEITFHDPVNIAANIAGDNIELQNVNKISAERARKSIKVLAK